MTEQNSGGTSAGDALDMAVGTAVAAAIVNDHPDKPVDAATLPPDCLNCGALVRGRYCIDCGQVTDTHVPTLGEVMGDALTSLFNLDSRLWRTLGALFLKPGQLTLDFLDGKRARHLPPLRLYLVMSLVFFLVASFDRDNDADEEESEEAAAIIREVNEDVAAELDAQGIDDLIAADLADDPDPDLPGRGVNFTIADGGGLTITDADGNVIEDDALENCEEMNLPVERGGSVDTAIRETCREGAADNYDSLKDAFADNIPLLAFLVIPVMAAVFKLFYAFTGRAYLGHLVFLCHTHAFTFMLIVLVMLLRALSSVAPVLSTTLTVVGYTLLLVYMPVYYFMALRRVYAQHWALTFIKLTTLSFLYLVVITLVFTFGFLVIALST